MGGEMKFIKSLIIVLLIFSVLIPSQTASAASLTAGKNFSTNLNAELYRYFKKSGGTISLQYQDLITGEGFQIKGKTSSRAASTIKLPLVLYIMELADKGKINMNQKLVYKSYHYYGGSGVIQYQKVGTSYTIRDLVKKAMIYSDNIAFIMLRERVGKGNFITYMKSLGAQYTYPRGQNLTSPNDLIIYLKRLYQFSQTSVYGKELVTYLQKTVYNTTIPTGIRGIPIAHKVGMIPESKIYNDAAIIYDKNPFVLSIMTNNLSYQKSQKVIADIAAIVYKHHKAKASAKYFITKTNVPVYQDVSKRKRLGTLQIGATFKIGSVQGSWYAIKFGKVRGFVERKWLSAIITPSVSKFTKTVPNSGIIKMKQNATVLNRISSGNIMGIINKNQEFYYSKKENNFYVIDLGGRIGYVDEKYVY
jgi:beta-lactamase class A